MTWYSTRGSGVRRAGLRGARVRPPRAQTGHVPQPPATLAGGRQTRYRGVRGNDPGRLARASPPGIVRDRRLQLRPARQRHEPAARAPVGLRGTTRTGRLAGIPAAAAAAFTAAAHLPDRLLRSVDPRDVAVLQRPRRPVEEPGTPRRTRGPLLL